MEPDSLAASSISGAASVAPSGSTSGVVMMMAESSNGGDRTLNTTFSVSEAEEVRSVAGSGGAAPASAQRGRDRLDQVEVVRPEGRRSRSPSMATGRSHSEYSAQRTVERPPFLPRSGSQPGLRGGEPPPGLALVPVSRMTPRRGGDEVPAVIRRTPRGRSYGAPPYEGLVPTTPRGHIQVHSATEVHAMEEDLDEPFDATKVLNMVRNDLSVQMGDVYVDQRQQQVAVDQRQQQAVFIDKVQIGGNDPSAQASFELMASERAEKAAAQATALTSAQAEAQHAKLMAQSKDEWSAALKAKDHRILELEALLWQKDEMLKNEQIRHKASEESSATQKATLEHEIERLKVAGRSLEENVAKSRSEVTKLEFRHP